MRLGFPALGILLVTSALATTAHDFGLDDLRLVGCKVVGDRIVLDRYFDQAKGSQLAMEAEDAVAVVTEPSGGLADPACSGGKCLVRVDRALFPVSVTRAGRYTRWVHGYFPQGGGWLHAESLDNGKQEWYTDCDGLTAGRWVWVKGPTYDLSAGAHLLWFHNWHGGALLDKVILQPEALPEPSGIGPASTPPVPARSGWVTTGALSVPGLTKLLDCRWPAEERGGKVALSLSLDGGGTYQPLTQEGLKRISASPVARIVLRADLQAAPDGTGPALAAPTVTYDTDPRAFVTLENQQVRVTFLRPTGAVVGIYDKLAKADCLTAAGTAPPFALRYCHKITGSI